MNRFKEQEIDLGVVKSGSNIVFNFETLEDIDKDIVSVTPSCGGCTDILGYDGKYMKVKFRSGIFPMHLQDNYYFVSKSIYVVYKDGSEERLSYRAKVIR